MRLRVILPILVLGCGILWALLALRPHPAIEHNLPAEKQPAPAVQEPAAATALAPVPSPTNQSMPTVAASQPEPNPADSPEQRIATRIAELQDLSRNDDTASLNTIVSEVTNPEPDIRKAALEAAKQFGSRDAIPGLRAIAEQATDPELKVEITKTIEFLQLPSLTEVLAQSQQKHPTR